MELTFEIITLSVLIALSGFFSGLEVALVGVTRSKVNQMLNKNIMKKDDKIIGILTGRQKEPLLPINYHNEPTNQFAKPPKQ